jgi:uncharacterized membrane protein
MTIFHVVGRYKVQQLIPPLTLIIFVVAGSIVSRFGMAIPLAIHKSIGAFEALKRSLKISNGHEGFLFLLVVESVVGSFVAGYAVFYGLALVVPALLRFTIWYGWLRYILSILAGAAVEPPLFLGFSLLAARE